MWMMGVISVLLLAAHAPAAGAGLLMKHPPKAVDECMGVGLAAIDITVPLQPTKLQLVALLYSFSTWVLVGTWFLATVATRHTVLVSGSAWVLCTLALNEGLFKKLLAAPRPAETCLTTNGMPSSHAILSVGLLVWLVLEVAHRDLAPAGRKSGCVAGLTLALLPVLPSRHVLGDHSFDQCAAGGLIGAAAGIAHFWVRGISVRAANTAPRLEKRIKNPRLDRRLGAGPALDDGAQAQAGSAGGSATVKPGSNLNVMLKAGAETGARYALRARTTR